MSIILISDQSPRADIEIGIARLRAKRGKVHDARWRADIDAEIDDLLDLWQAAGEGP